MLRAELGEAEPSRRVELEEVAIAAPRELPPAVDRGRQRGQRADLARAARPAFGGQGLSGPDPARAPGTARRPLPTQS